MRLLLCLTACISCAAEPVEPPSVGMTDPDRPVPLELREAPAYTTVEEAEGVAARERVVALLAARRQGQEDARQLRAAETDALPPAPVPARGEFCKIIQCEPKIVWTCKDGDAGMYLPLGWVRMSPEEYCDQRIK